MLIILSIAVYTFFFVLRVSEVTCVYFDICFLDYFNGVSFASLESKYIHDGQLQILFKKFYKLLFVTVIARSLLYILNQLIWSPISEEVKRIL